MVENFAETNNYYHTELMTYLEMLLEAQRVKNLSVTELLHRWQQIRAGMLRILSSRPQSVVSAGSS
jgi:hypothetical protein